MTGTDPLEDEVRATLARLAAERAPERLAARVSGIPARESRAWRPRLGLVLGQLAAAAAVVVVVVAVLVARTGGGGTGGPGSPSPSAPISSATVPASPVASPTPAATSPATPAPSPTSSAGAPPSQVAGPAGGPVPAGFRPASVTFASPTLGWVLGTAPCASAPCTSIVRTTDGGRTWKGIPAPVANLVDGVCPGCAPGGVGRLRFADALDGWAFGPGLWATHDGGATWHGVQIAGVTPGAPVVALEAAAGVVHAAIYDGSGVRIATSPAMSDDWRLASETIDVGAGPVPQTQIVLQGATGWLLQVDRTVVGGARLVNGRWSSWTPVCATVVGPAILAASSVSDLAAVCNVGAWGGIPKGDQLFASTDGGASFALAKDRLPIDVSAVTAATRSVIVLGGYAPAGMAGGPTTALVRSADGGATWRTVFTGSSGEQVSELGFTTVSQGVAILSDGSTRSRLLLTRDGGATWAVVVFRAP